MIEQRTYRPNTSDLGIVYVAVGKPYADVFPAVVEHTLAVLPETSVTVFITHPKLDDPLLTVREAFAQRTLLWYLSPYKKTLFLDLDSTVYTRAILSFADALDENDVVLRPINAPGMHMRNMPRYNWVRDHLGYPEVCPIPTGGIWAFRNSSGAKHFFDTWHTAWVRMGRYSDMPCLAWAAENTEARVHIHLDKGWEKQYCEKWFVNGQLAFEQANGTSVDHEYAKRWYHLMQEPDDPQVYDGAITPPDYATGYKEIAINV